MPMYFPDLKSVKELAITMTTRQSPENKYKGIIPETEKDLPEARKQLGIYFRTIWNDEIQALEVELGVSKENYKERITEALKIKETIGRKK